MPWKEGKRRLVGCGLEFLSSNEESGVLCVLFYGPKAGKSEAEDSLGPVVCTVVLSNMKGPLQSVFR